jgi:uncharacterized protein YbjT (DUF2867 family)
MIAVMGATGNTGGRVAEILLSRGQKVRAIGRDEGKLKPLVDKGAEAAVGDAADADFLARAFEGADAVYTLLPPDMKTEDLRAFQDRVGIATVAALKRAGVKRVVLLSSQGADVPTGTGPIAGLHAQEGRLRALGIDVLLLRPGYFFENTYGNLPLVKHQGINGGALAPDVRMSMIATRDIAEAAAKALLARDFEGVVVRDLLGERDLTQAEVTRIFGEKIGRPDLPYVQFPYDGFAQALVQAGLSKDVARLYAEMSAAFNEGRIALTPRTPANTTPTSFETFAGELAQAYAQA